MRNLERQQIYRVFVAIIVISITSCSTSQMSVSRSKESFRINTIALMPGGGILSDAVGSELLTFGLSVIDTSTVSSIMLRNNISEVELTLPQNLETLAERGIDAILIVRLATGFDEKPQSASFRLISTQGGKLILGGSWQNAQGGRQGSIADAVVRQDLNAAAREIAKGIASALEQ